MTDVEYETPPAIALLYPLLVMARIHPALFLRAAASLTAACLTMAMPDNVVVVSA